MNTAHAPDRRERPPIYASRYASTSTDRRGEYYASLASRPGHDWQDHAWRVARGPRWQTNFNAAVEMTAEAYERQECLDASERSTTERAWQ